MILDAKFLLKARRETQLPVLHWIKTLWAVLVLNRSDHVQLMSHREKDFPIFPQHHLLNAPLKAFHLLNPALNESFIAKEMCPSQKKEKHASVVNILI